MSIAAVAGGGTGTVRPLDMSVKWEYNVGLQQCSSWFAAEAVAVHENSVTAGLLLRLYL